MQLPDSTVKALWIAFFVLIAVVLVQNIIIFTSMQTQGPTGLPVHGEVRICITGQVPFWQSPVDCEPARVGVPYTCNLTEHIFPPIDYLYSISVLAGNPNASALFTNSTDGMLSFTATADLEGAYELQLTAQTPGACPTTNTTIFNLSIIDEFGPPILIQPIPNSTWEQDSILVPYNMRNYWFDPAGAVEFLQYSVSGNQDITVTFQPTGEVTLTPRAGWCGTEVVRYTATSPWTNLSTESNLVELEVTCTPDSGQQQPGGGTFGGGAGGGGAASPPRACIEDIFCYEWSECQYTHAVTETGDRLELIIEGVRGARTYLVEEMPENVSIFYMGYRTRECFDTRGCDTREIFYVDTCEFEPSCFDGIQNQDETGVDCGGVCPPCQDDEPDRVETPDFVPPVDRQEPAFIDAENPVTMLLFYLALSLAAIILLLLWLKSLVKSLLRKLIFKHKRKHRTVLLDINAKQRILDALIDIESRIGIDPVLKLQEELSGVVREYFKSILGLEFEFTYQELQEQLEQQHVLESLKDILESFFNRSSELEFSGKPITELVLRALISEVREIVYQTAVLSQQDYKDLDKDLSFRTIPDDIPERDRFYLLLSQGHIAIQFGRVEAGRQIYRSLQYVYQASSAQTQALVYQDLKRFYLELSFAMRHKFFAKKLE